jgi:cytochrome b pre-mRNA-processing protein 3
MILPRFRRTAQRDTISALYGTIVAQARLPSFYRDYGVADSIDGRFDLILLHLTLVLARLRASPETQDLAQLLFDWFCKDMDHNLREMGISDLKVPDEMRRMGEAFYGRAQAYETGLAGEGNDALSEAVVRNIYNGHPPGSPVVAWLATYIREAEGGLQKQDDSVLAKGILHWPVLAPIS